MKLRTARIVIWSMIGACVTVVDRIVHKVPNWLAIVLYSAAVILIITGMIVGKRAAA